MIEESLLALQESCGLQFNKTAKIPSKWIFDNKTSCNVPKSNNSRLESVRETSDSVKADDVMELGLSLIHI